MPRKILRRCSLCGKFHASYLVPNPDGGNSYYCSACWKATQTPGAGRTTQPAGATPESVQKREQGGKN